MNIQFNNKGGGRKPQRSVQPRGKQQANKYAGRQQDKRFGRQPDQQADAPVRRASQQRGSFGGASGQADAEESRDGKSDGRTCPVSARCGGCSCIEDPYESQLAAKNEFVAELFQSVVPQNAIKPILGMENPYWYRDKVISPYAPGRKLSDGRGSRSGASDGARGKKDKSAKPRYEILTGMYEVGSHRLIPTDSCLTENKEAKAITLAIRDIMRKYGVAPYNEDQGTGFMRHAIVRVGHESGEVLVTLVTNAEEFPAARSFCKELVQRCPAVTTVVQNVNTRQTNVILGQKERTLYGPGFILDTLCGLSFRISSSSFYQVNCTQTEVLYNQVMRLAKLTGQETVIDAYCGTGTIGLVAAKNGAAKVIGVDSVPAAIRDAKQNARHNGIQNARFETADAGAFMHAMADRGERADVLLMDPPRAGSSEEFLDAAAALAPKRIVYVSCNPKTQVRDIKHLQRHGYAVRELQPVDMFPHTDHVETVALLEK